MAVHEAGHALVVLLSEHADPVAKITIPPAGRALGSPNSCPSTSGTFTPRATYSTPWPSAWAAEPRRSW